MRIYDVLINENEENNIYVIKCDCIEIAIGNIALRAMKRPARSSTNKKTMRSSHHSRVSTLAQIRAHDKSRAVSPALLSSPPQQGSLRISEPPRDQSAQESTLLSGVSLVRGSRSVNLYLSSSSVSAGSCRPFPIFEQRGRGAFTRASRGARY